jgi:hypothetical protein
MRTHSYPAFLIAFRLGSLSSATTQQNVRTPSAALCSLMARFAVPAYPRPRYRGSMFYKHLPELGGQLSSAE